MGVGKITRKTAPLTVHRRHFFPRSCNRVEFPTRVEIFQSIETSDCVNIMVHNNRSVVRSRPVRVFLKNARPTVRLGVVRLDERGRTATAPTTDRKQHFERVPGPSKHRRNGVGHVRS